MSEHHISKKVPNVQCVCVCLSVCSISWAHLHPYQILLLCGRGSVYYLEWMEVSAYFRDRQAFLSLDKALINSSTYFR